MHVHIAAIKCFKITAETIAILLVFLLACHMLSSAFLGTTQELSWVCCSGTMGENKFNFKKLIFNFTVRHVFTRFTRPFNRYSNVLYFVE